MRLRYPKIQQLARTDGGRPVFRLLEDFSLEVSLGRAAYTFYIPAETVTDFASIPRACWCVLNPLDPTLTVAALIHDDLCQAPHCDRFTADAWMRHVMRLYGACVVKQLTVFYLLRLYCWATWK